MADTSNSVADSKAYLSFHKIPILIRLFGWSVLAVMAAFLINNFLSYGMGLPGADINFIGQYSWLNPGLYQSLLYPLLIALACLYVLSKTKTSLRADSMSISSINTFLIRAAFWCVLLIGLVDTTISFLRVEDFLKYFANDDLVKSLARAQFRGPYVHIPLIGLGIVIATFTRTLGFHWLALLIVAAELLIVFSRFIFSYEQAFMSDLVRFWYGALFLFASAYTLLEEGHVRVDVFYAGYRDKTKGYVNAIGSVFMGMALCWTILIVGMGNQASVINSPLFNFEVTQSGFGLYVKYLMAAFLGIFAISMMIQFVSYLFGAAADIRGEVDKYQPSASGAH